MTSHSRSGAGDGVWRDVAAGVAAMLTYVCVARGLLYYAPLLQLPLIAGVTAGVIATSRERSVIAAVGAALVGSILVKPFALTDAEGLVALGVLGVVVLGSGAAALAARWASERFGRRARAVVTYGVLGLLIANLWATSITLVARPYTAEGRSGIDVLGEQPAAGETLSDDAFYRRVMWLTDDGEGFYEAFRRAYNDNPRWAADPTSVLAVRLPTVFWLWDVVPGKPWGVVVAYLVLATGTALGAVAVALGRTYLPFAIPAVAGVAGLALFTASTSAVFLTEPWAVPFGVAALAAHVWSLRSERWKTWTILAVVAACAAVAIRELMAYVMVAGIAAAWFGPSEQRRFRLTAWGAGVLSLAGGYAAHAAAASGIVHPAGDLSPWLNGGFGNLVLALDWSAEYLGGTALVPSLLGALAILGAARAKRASDRAFALVACLVPLSAFIVFGNAATAAEGGSAINYWGAIVVPVLFALSPWAFAAIPGLDRESAVGDNSHPVTTNRRKESR